MSEKFGVIPGRKIGALVCAAGFGAVQGALHDGFRYVQHEAEFQDRFELRVEGAAAVIKSNIFESLLQFAEFAGSVVECCSLAVNSRAFLYGLLHLLTNGGNVFAAASLL